tara:strand:- start:605 stop:844 length:240 start_codon:yes stop_codon:yes gene_type:complete
MNCQNCKYPNKEKWFYCRACGERANKSKFTTNVFMGSDIGARSDIEFSTIDSETHVKNLEKQRIKKSQKFWKEQVNAVR